MVSNKKDITEPIPTTVGNPQNTPVFSGNTVAYDVSIGGQPFFLLNEDNNPYRRVTAQYRKQQIDQTREPGEQTLTGWWLRSQSSFHLGQGIKFFEPAQDESLRFQYTYSKGCDVWTKGQVTLLPKTNYIANTGAYIANNGRPQQIARSIRENDNNSVLLMDTPYIYKVYPETSTSSGGTVLFEDENVDVHTLYAICDDGVYAYFIRQNTSVGGFDLLKKALADDYTVPATLMFNETSITVTNAVMEYTKERIVACINEKVYEISATASSLPSALYTHPVNDFVFTSITSSGAAIYLAGYSGVQSAIYKFTLTNAGAMPVLSSAITAAEMPVGERIFKIVYYLGNMAIGTNLGARVAAVSDQDGSIAYGPLIFESEQPVYDVCFRDKYLWCATNVDGYPGLTRINLGQQISPLVYAYAWDLYIPDDNARNIHKTTSCAFAGNSDQIVFTTDYISATAPEVDGAIYGQHYADKIEQGLIRGGYVRYNTLENKIFKYVVPRFDTVNGALTVYSYDQFDNRYSLGTYAQNSSIGQIGISYPAGSQQYIGFEFVMDRSTTDSTLGPLFTGYQLKVLPAIPRQRLIQYPCSLFDSESDKFGNKAGYEGAAYDRLKQIEAIESNGDTIVIQDFRPTTQETYTGIIEEIDFINKTPTDKRYSGFGGLCLITIRTIS